MSKELNIRFITPKKKVTKYSKIYKAINELLADDSNKQGIRITCDNVEQMRSLFNRLYQKYPELNRRTVIAEKAVLIWKKGI